MESSCKVTIIVPIYNVEKYLDQCIESIVNQTYKNLEIILVDDGSPDQSPAKCDEWAKKDSRIKVIHKKNGGLSSARNAGLDIFSGDFVFFVDSDDWLEFDAVDSMLTFSIDNDADIVAGTFYFEKAAGTNEILKSDRKIYENEEIVLNLLLDNIRPEVCSKLYRSDLIKSYRFNENIKYAEDLPFNFYLMLNAKKLVSTGVPCYHYRLNSENSITASYMTDARAKSWKMFDDIIKRCQENDNLKKAAVYRFTVYTFAVLSRVIAVKEYRKKYFNIIADILIAHKEEILKNPYVSTKHKTAEKIISLNKNIFKLISFALPIGTKIINALKNIAAYFVFGIQTAAYTVKAMILKLKNKKNFLFLLLTPCHENYGDQAIALAEKELLKDKYIFEITGDMLIRFLNYPLLIKTMLGKSTLVFQGGGYLGTFWFNYGEKLLRGVMKLVPKNKIIVMPQSIYYENNEEGEMRLNESKKIYSECADLTLTARDKISFELMKNFYPEASIYLIPDIVLYLDKCRKESRNGVMLTFRDDIEKGISYSLQDKIEKFSKENYKDVRKIDMLADHRIKSKTRARELEVQFERFRKSELVFTDRLHGMIFAAITGTPCVVLPNKSHKVKGVYDWLFKKCEYIIFTEDLDEIRVFAEKVQGKSFKYDNSSLKPYYDKLIEIIDGVESIE